MSNERSNLECNNEGGYVFILFSVVILGLLMCVSFAIDVGFAYWEKQNIQLATDAGALSGVKELLTAGVTQSDVEQAVVDVAAANGLSIAEINSAGGIETGIWNVATKSFVASSNMSLVNAVRVRAKREVGTFFAKVMGFSSLLPHVMSIAVQDFPTFSNCPVPYGIEDDLLMGVIYGDILEVDRDSPGNWGKLDIGGNMSSGPNFIQAMQANTCNASVAVGATVNPGTGFAGVIDGFEARALINPVMVVAVVDGFPNGNSTPVTIKGFVVVEIVSISGNGANWKAELRFLEEFGGEGVGGPSGGPLSLSRALVR